MTINPIHLSLSKNLLMQFKHPELLYALFLLLIPIFIHLFQLRRFQKIDFTNVAFLKKISLQTRKSSQLKKWLTLLLRLLAYASIIIAFAQPFISSKTALNTQKETVIYIDNSFSMQAKGAEGTLLQRALQQLFEKIPSQTKISWFTNTTQVKNSNQTDFKHQILKVPYTYQQLSLPEILLKANTLFSKNKQSLKRLVLISDFQSRSAFPKIPENVQVDVVQLKPLKAQNISIDSIYIAKNTIETTQLKVSVTKQSDNQNNIAVSLFNDINLVAKTATNFDKNPSSTITFDIENKSNFKGIINLEDPYLTFDNQLYFAINLPEKTKVLSINEADASFLQRIFNSSEFKYTQQSYKKLDYSTIPQQNFIILNELKTFPSSLIEALQSFSKNGGSICIIPSENASTKNYNQLLSVLQLGNISEKMVSEKKISKINFSHPLYKQVFEKQEDNFQYPKVNSYFNIQTRSGVALRFEDNKPFIIKKGSHYFCTAAINQNNSNFQSAPLIVPTLYNMAIQSMPLPKLYYYVGKQNQFSVPIRLQQDEILVLKDSVTKIIPLQETKANQVNITTQELPSQAGIYDVKKGKQVLSNIAYNYPRTESILNYTDCNNWEGTTLYTSVTELFNKIEQENLIHHFWKWFAIFALLFLLLEMVVLKFLK